MINYKYYSLSMSVNTFCKLTDINICTKNHDLRYHNDNSVKYVILLPLKNTPF